MNIKKIIRSERGDVSYISTFVYILVAMIMVAFILNVFHIISVKQEMDHISDQLVKQIQLNGGTNADTGALFSYLAAPLSEVEGSNLSGNQLRKYQQNPDRNSLLCDSNRKMLSGWLLETESGPD